MKSRSFNRSFPSSITSLDGVNLNFACFRDIRKEGIPIKVPPHMTRDCYSLTDVASMGISDGSLFW